ncbi:hypothetical protein ALC57_00460 [Trachymyrmex cornetzi]|uniref:DNA-directed DNA polymerase n=1 Tax=Trachymyrmex cornetzi TaxID=471704 RepID=A0A151JRT3_9HYME|nr:hypothetical protein ALC57_00460 [Trachymyrmex cornetzi]
MARDRRRVRKSYSDRRGDKLDHIEPRQFLEDAGNVVLERVRDVERHDNVKVNTAFNGEFATKDKRANKSIITKNSEIYRAFIILARAKNCRRAKWKINNCAIRPPCVDDKWLEFSNHCNQERMSFIVYRGSAHSNCNLNYKNLFYIPVVFHNLSRYDAQFIIKEIATAYDGHVDLLPITKEKYISFTKHVDSTKDKNEKNFHKNCVKLRFIDSFKFLSISLDKLVSYLDKDKLKIVRSEFCKLSAKDFDLLTRKVVFLYEYVNCVEKLQDTLLPPRKLFFSSLTGDTMDRRPNVSAVAPDSSTGYILKVDLEYLQHRDYIELNTQFRTRAKNDFEKNLYKLMNNAVFGKTMENVHNHVDVKLLTKWDGRYGAEAMIAKLNFHSRSVFAENLIAVELRKLEVKFDKLIYVSMCILHISKVCLYEFQYEYISPMFQDKYKIMYTDTDSLIYRIECDDAYETMKRDITRFETSDYPADNAYGMPLANKKVLGLMKDENNSVLMTELVGLRVKMYAVRVDGKKDTKKAKGVKSNVVARTITFDDYTRYLNEEIEMTRRQSCIRCKLHEVYTISESKIALSPYDDKR